MLCACSLANGRSFDLASNLASVCCESHREYSPKLPRLATSQLQQGCGFLVSQRVDGMQIRCLSRRVGMWIIQIGLETAVVPM